MSLLYIYSLKEQPSLDSLNYYPEVILDFNNSQNFFKNYPKLMKENIMKELNYSESYLYSMYECRICLSN